MIKTNEVINLKAKRRQQQLLTKKKKAKLSLANDEKDTLLIWR